MVKALVFILCLPALVSAQSDDLGSAALAALQAELEKDSPRDTGVLLDRLASSQGVPEPEVRRRLLALLDRLEGHSSGQTQVWKELIQLRGSEIKAGRAEGFLRNLTTQGKKILADKDPYDLRQSLRFAARNARLAVSEAQMGQYLAKVLKKGIKTEGAQQEHQFLVIVSGRTNRFEINKDPLYIFFDTQDEAFVLEEVREVQRFVLPLLVRQIKRSPSVKWAARQRETNVLVDPDFLLRFEVDNLSFTGSNANMRPCMEASLFLTEGGADRPAWTDELNFCTEDNGSAAADDLQPFFEEVAAKAYEQVEEYFAQLRTGR